MAQEADSHILRINATSRLMHLAGVLPVTRPAKNAFTPLESRVYYIAGGHLALKHFNERSDAVISDLKQRLEGCDIQLGIEYRDTQYSRIAGARHLTEILESQPPPAALVGAGRSDVSETISTLSGMFRLPQISPHSSAASLDDKIKYPYFARTTPSNAADGKAAVDYLHHLEVSHMAVIYILDTNGIAYQQAIQREASAHNMTVFSIPYLHDAGGEDSMVQALQRLRDVSVRYVFAVIEPATWKQFIRIAVNEGVIGNAEYVWLFHSGMVGLVPEELQADTEYDIARAIHGSGVLLKDFPGNEIVDAELVKLENDTRLQQDFVSKWSEPEVFDGFDFRYPGPNYPQYINYDTIMALGFAACDIDTDFFTGDELYQSLLRTEFQGASDYVSFDNATGTRNSVPFRVDNILMVDKGNKDDKGNILGFVQSPAARVNTHDITVLKEFIYWDNTTTIPLVLPALEQDTNPIPTGLLAMGLTLCSLSMLLAVCWSIWTYYYRNSEVVKVSQPFFLIQLCIGSFLMASSIIPMSLQEPALRTQGLDIACMTIPWLLITGYATSFAALFSKSWRVNMLLKKGKQLRRLRVGIADTMFFLVTLMGINVVLLTAWTLVSPLTWQRIEVANFDQYGRVTESYGRCKGDGSTEYKVIISLLGIVNGLALVFTNYQGFKTHSLPTAFDESYYVAVTNASLLEALILGIPILVLANDSPSASYIVKVILVTVVCLCTLLPLFVPKHLQRNADAAREEQSKRSLRRRSSRFLSNNSSTYMQSARSLGSIEFAPDPPSDPDACLGSRVTRHPDYYVQRKLSPPPALGESDIRGP